jgi:hypothetical protein
MPHFEAIENLERDVGHKAAVIGDAAGKMPLTARLERRPLL